MATRILQARWLLLTETTHFILHGLRAFVALKLSYVRFISFNYLFLSLHILLKFFDQALLCLNDLAHSLERFQSFLRILRLVDVWHSSYQSPEPLAGWSSRKQVGLIIGEAIQLVEEALLDWWDGSSTVRLKVLNFLVRGTGVSIRRALGTCCRVVVFMDGIQLILAFFGWAGYYILMVLFAGRRCLFVDLPFGLRLITRNSQSIRIGVNQDLIFIALMICHSVPVREGLPGEVWIWHFVDWHQHTGWVRSWDLDRFATLRRGSGNLTSLLHLEFLYALNEVIPALGGCASGLVRLILF